MTLPQEGNFKEIFKTDEGNFVRNEEKLWAKQEILCCRSGYPGCESTADRGYFKSVEEIALKFLLKIGPKCAEIDKLWIIHAISVNSQC